MRRRSSTPTVTLFPFLAVLVCTMGSLILLLLVTTRKIRHDVEMDRAVPPVAAGAVDPAPAEDENARSRALALRQREEEIQARLEAQRLAAAQRQRELEQARSHWQAQLTALSERNRQLVRQLSSARDSLAEKTASVSRVEAERQRLAGLIATAADRTDQIKTSESRLQDEALHLVQERERVRREIEAAKVQQALRKPRFEIVAYDGNSRTERRPILIECRSDALTFAAEQISISAATLNEFPPEQNPLLAGTEALLAYWTLVDRQAGQQSSRPYVLLVVRPGGTVAFYVARKYLEKLDQDFGYELIGPNDDVRWPDPDPQAVEVCRNAVESAMRGPRPDVVKNLGGFGAAGAGGFAGREQIAGGNGEFSLPEVERLKNSPPGDSIDMLGPEWDPQRRRSGGSGGTPASPAAGGTFNRAAAAAQAAGSFTEMAAAESEAAMRQRAAESSHPLGQNPAASPSAASQPRPAEPSTARTGQRGGPPGKPLPKPESSLPGPPLSPEQFRNDGGAHKQWGKARGGAIGIERDVTLHVYPDKIEIIDFRTISLPPEVGRAELQDSVAELVQAQALTWGDPPGSFTWRPALNIKIHPGGNQHYPRLKELVEHWGLRSSVEQVLD